MSRRAELRAQARRAWARIRGGELTPRRAFWSVGLGVFIGVLPTPGLHIFMVLGLFLPLRLDAAVGYLSANISIPPVAPFLWLASIQIGAVLLRGEAIPLTVEGAKELLHAPGPMLTYLALGAPILGLGLALPTGGLAFAIARARRSAKARLAEPFSAAALRTTSRFRAAGGSRSTPYYVRAKLFGDPVTRALDERRPLGEVLDLGCGHGHLALFLLESGAATKVTGCDWDAAKIALASRAAPDAKARFIHQDLGAVTDETEALSPADTVLLVDVLHYLGKGAQDALLLRAASLVRPGGRLFVRDASKGFGARSFATSCVERVSRAVRWHRGERIALRDVAADLVPQLEEAGMSCELEPCWRGTPFSNVLVVARRKPA